MSHTPEPWRVESGPHDSSSFYIRGTKSDGSEMTWGLGSVSHIPRSTKLPSEANARRIVACVNACSGVPLDWLESGLDGCVQGVREERDEYQNRNNTLMLQRDELLAAARAVVDRWDSPGWKEGTRTSETINRLRTAIELTTKKEAK